MNTTGVINISTFGAIVIGAFVFGALATMLACLHWYINSEPMPPIETIGGREWGEH